MQAEIIQEPSSSISASDHHIMMFAIQIKVRRLPVVAKKTIPQVNQTRVERTDLYKSSKICLLQEMLKVTIALKLGQKVTKAFTSQTRIDK